MKGTYTVIIPTTSPIESKVSVGIVSVGLKVAQDDRPSSVV